jgi:hypothetical protein
MLFTGTMSPMLTDEDDLVEARQLNRKLAGYPRFSVRSRFAPILIQALLRLSQVGGGRTAKRIGLSVEDHVVEAAGQKVCVRLLRPRRPCARRHPRHPRRRLGDRQRANERCSEHSLDPGVRCSGGFSGLPAGRTHANPGTAAAAASIATLRGSWRPSSSDHVRWRTRSSAGRYAANGGALARRGAR